MFLLAQSTAGVQDLFTSLIGSNIQQKLAQITAELMLFPSRPFTLEY